jgi:hypothetical protein
MPVQMMLAVVVGLAAAAWLHERSLERKERQRQRRLVAEDTAIWETSGLYLDGRPASPAARGDATADARVAAAVQRAAQAEAEAAAAMELAQEAVLELERLRHQRHASRQLDLSDGDDASS